MPKDRVLRHVLGPILAIAILGAACIEEAEPPSGATAGGETPAEAAGSLLYMKRRALMRYDLARGEEERLGRLPSADVAVSPDGARFVVVEETAGASNPDEYVSPRLRLGEVADPEGTSDLGPGSAPRWSPDGSNVAAVVGGIGSICERGAQIKNPDDPPEGCHPAEQIVSFPADGREAEAIIVLGPTIGWSLLGFTDGNRVAGIADGEGIAISAPEGDGDPMPLGFEPSEIWDVSPTQLLVLVVEDGSTFFTAPGEGGRPEIDLGGASLGDGTWSPDGGRVAAVLQGGSGESRLGIIDVETNEVEEVPGSEGAHGNVVWSGDGSFAFVRSDPEGPGRLQAMVCSADLSCEEAMSWGRGVSLLAVEGQPDD